MPATSPPPANFFPYLSGERRKQSLGPDPLMHFTSKAPHSCKYCKRITLDLSTTAQFSCSIREAFAADQDGCALFQACFDGIRKTWKSYRWDDGIADRDDMTFEVNYVKELPYHTASLLLNLMLNEKLDDGTDKTSVYEQTTLFLWTDEDDAASVDITTRPYELDYNSAATVKFARNCVQSCQQDHKECRRSTGGEKDGQGRELIDHNSIPSRLIHLVVKDSVLYARLIGKDFSSEIPKDEVSHQGYAILSYCWGGPQPVQLTHDSIGGFVDGIPISCLPKSLRDAAWFTNEMGLKYLWIDALCMFQDDADDKIYEISRMELYYSHSTVTICAASAARCSDGFLLSREDDPTDYSIGPIQLQCTASTGAPGTVQALLLDDDFNMKRPLQPIATRGWTFQEALLSRRILMFSPRQLYFTCTVANASCGGFEPTLWRRMMPSYESRVVGVYTFSGLRSYPIKYIWNFVVAEYSKRHLGLTADKLPAVAAMASNVVSLGRERSQKLVYLAGLMLDDSDTDNYMWRTEFLWAVKQMKESSHIPGRAPSWSWSSIDGPIMSLGWGEPSDATGADGIVLVQRGVELENELAPFGAVKGGFAKIRTRTRNLCSIVGLNYTISTRRDRINQRIDPSKTVLVLNPDTKERMEMVCRDIQGEGDVFLVELIPFYERSVSPAGIIVTRAPGTNCYVRIGMFEFKKPDNLPNRMAETEMGIASRRTLFDSLPFHEICII
ncbi:HET-domain-containing protein [Hypoxylon rubiginosum]|uniref:HET-domain-containing protein n=1 Tax=Hypoxylon rubiginosum TaxID=110542 RepID=A0ACC0CUF2_9PEZI|nr:HET-domain-containing protein [Hypoxylon rubiginosum]